MPNSFEERLRALFREHDDLENLLDQAERLAKKRNVFAQRRGYEGYETVRAALALAVAVWEAEGERRVAGGS